MGIFGQIRYPKCVKIQNFQLRYPKCVKIKKIHGNFLFWHILDTVFGPKYSMILLFTLYVSTSILRPVSVSKITGKRRTVNLWSDAIERGVWSVYCVCLGLSVRILRIRSVIWSNRTLTVFEPLIPRSATGKDKSAWCHLNPRRVYKVLHWLKHTCTGSECRYRTAEILHRSISLNVKSNHMLWVFIRSASPRRGASDEFPQHKWQSLCFMVFPEIRKIRTEFGW